jgi:hypothetical protein
VPALVSVIKSGSAKLSASVNFNTVAHAKAGKHVLRNAFTAPIFSVSIGDALTYFQLTGN